MTKEQRRELRQARRTEAIINKGGKCACCGNTTSLQFHHMDSTTKVSSMAIIWEYGENKREEELAKCILLCKTCHKGLHKQLGYKVSKEETLAYIEAGR